MVNLLPFISIIIPTYNRPDQLCACLECLAGLDYPRDRFEVIVVDDGSDTSPQEIVDSVRDRLDARLLRRPNGGPAAARNAGAAQARGAFLAFTDDDCFPAPDWLYELAVCFSGKPDHAVGGRTLNGLDKNPFSAFSQMIIDTAYRHYNRDPERASFFASNNLAVPAEAFRAAGGFDPGFRTSEDREFCDRWIHLSHGLMYAPRAVVSHANNLSFFSFCRQHFNYGRGAFRFYRARALRGSGGYSPDGGFYRSVMIRPDLRLRGKETFRGEARRLCLLLLWLAVNTFGFAGEALTLLKVPRKRVSVGIREE